MTFPLWSDEPAVQDLLSFKAVAATVADALFDDGLDPVAIGLSGAWGSGKTSVLELVKAEIEQRSQEAGFEVLVIPTQPWLYDPAVGPKESLIAEVLGALSKEFSETDPAGKAALDGIKKLIRKVNWSKAVKLATKTAVTMQIPKLDDVLGLVSDDPDTLDGDKGMAGFREDFAKLLSDPALAHVERTVVLVDDLDRCLPDTVVETLEAIRLFLSAKGMSFVIAADEDRVAEAIQQKFKTSDAVAEEHESPAKLYLHKIVQTTIPLPGLSRFDTHAYLFLLLVRSELESEDAFTALIEQCDDLRRSGDSIDDLTLPPGSDLTQHLATAARLTPILYEKFHGNPRRIKRFLNDLNVRQAVAGRRGIALESDAIAKLMVLERLLENDFKRVIDWLATNHLRDRLEALDALANQAPLAAPETHTDTVGEQDGEDSSERSAPVATEEAFSDTLIRWAKLPPTLDATTISGYLYLAASFAKIEVIDTGLPERLRDLAAALSSSLKLDRAGISDQVLCGLPESDAQTLISHLGRRTRDQPSIQKFTIESMLRIARAHPGTQPGVVTALQAIPVVDVEPVTAMKLRPLDATSYKPVLDTWEAGQPGEDLARTIQVVRTGWLSASGN
ncbi:P-loop NTPase fold protein [Rhodococcus sp. NPDC057529]|uniref:KAP family P-loop NTPase fold protein n=1 Tax=Rhodococcus sp. NPDC057529 TaxID=3346158 RepID=UPI00366C9BA0